MRNFFLQAYLSYRGLFLWLNWPAYTSMVFLKPVLLVLLFGVAGRFASNPDVGRAFVIGIAAYSIANMVLDGVIQSLFYDRLFGTISFLFLSPVNRLLAFSSRALLHLPNGIMSFVVALLAAWLVLDVDLSSANWLSLACSVVAICLSCTGFALMAGSFAIVFREWINIRAISNGILLAMTGVILPVSSLPGLLSQTSQLLPLTRGLTSLRESLDGAGLVLVREELLLELLVGLVYAVAGFLLFRVFEARSKHSGSLEIMG